MTVNNVVTQKTLESNVGSVFTTYGYSFVKTPYSNVFICVPRWYETFCYDEEKYHALSDRVAVECTAKGEIIVEPCYGQLRYDEAATTLLQSGLTRLIVRPCIPLALECPVRGERYYRALLPKGDILTRPPNDLTREYDCTGDGDHRRLSVVRAPTKVPYLTLWLPVVRITSPVCGRSLKQPNGTKLFDVLNNI